VTALRVAPRSAGSAALGREGGGGVASDMRRGSFIGDEGGSLIGGRLTGGTRENSTTAQDAAGLAAWLLAAAEVKMFCAFNFR
jgi:hypothetical protein